jgi:hypothetical protein
MPDTNFSQWNPGAANQENDATFQADSQRLSGAVNGEFWNDVLANKLLYQNSTFIRALALALVNKGYSPQDGTTPYTADSSTNAAVSALATVFANILTNADDVVQVPGSINITNADAPISPAEAIFTPAADAVFCLKFYAKIITPASATSTLGPLTLTWTDPDGVAQSQVISCVVANALVTSRTDNTLTTVLSGIPFVFAAGPGSAVEYTFGYAHGGSTMNFELFIRVEQVPPLT